ncbi:helix-turn-helix domain-containing protein [Methylobacterium nigriterrae]|uniref:helix-turn-helix domain-containing protein n=1 Tax=Methylobacterium nigriterrae TaxID=3127512 RepID=UPI003013FE81
MLRESHLTPDALAAMAERLRNLRATTGLSQQKFATSFGLGHSQWANFESAKHRIGIDAALTLRREMGVPLDWIYLGDTACLPAALKDELRKAARWSTNQETL